MKTNQDGYSLLEVMVVTALVGVIATLSVTSMQSLSLQRQKRMAASEMSALLNQARFMARGTSTLATITVTPVTAAPGGSLRATIGPPVNWTQSVNLGAGGNYNAAGLIAASATPATYTMTPRGMVLDNTSTPATIMLKLQDRDFSINADEVTVTVGLLGDVGISP